LIITFKRRNHSTDLGVDERIILKMDLGALELGLEPPGSGQRQDLVNTGIRNCN
jgi:hypothetical protein